MCLTLFQHWQHRLATVAAVLVVIVLWLAQPVSAANRDVAEPSALTRHSEHIDELINQLGDPDYHLRRRAEEELLRLGRDVFDQLQQVEDHPDLEVASRAAYILQKIDIQWSHPGDSEEVRLLLHRYANLSVDQRVERIDELAALDRLAGLPALARLARFEPSLQLARYAAMKILAMEVAEEDVSASVESILQELGNSRRVPVRWVRTCVEEMQEGQPKVDVWLEFIEADRKLLDEDSPDTKRGIVVGLIDQILKKFDKSNPAEVVAEFLRQRIEVSASEESPVQVGLHHAFSWLWRAEHWEVSGILEDWYADQIRDDRMSIYYVALVRWRQGREDAAQKLAGEAFHLDADDTVERSTIGSRVAEFGRHDWSEREWQYAIDNLPVMQTFEARHSLALFGYHDRGDNAQAAQLLVELCEALEADPQWKDEIMGHEFLRQYFANRDYLLACDAADKGDYELQRKRLETAFRYEKLNADILIAMYRSPGADEAYHKKTLDRIRKVSVELDKQIAEYPEVAQPMNHWAWLISNTEGDYQKAVARSQRSLELHPNNPSFLDTLGRCYYSAGKLEEAVAVQRRAVDLHPHLQVMQKQLRLFEEELDKQQ